MMIQKTKKHGTRSIQTLRALEYLLEQIRMDLLQKCQSKLKGLSTEQRQSVERVTLSINNKVLDEVRLRCSEANQPEDESRVAGTIEKIWALDEVSLSK